MLEIDEALVLQRRTLNIMPSNLEELTAWAMVQDGGVLIDTPVEEIECGTVEEPSWIQADLTSFCHVIGVSAPALKFFTKVIDQESHPSIRLFVQHHGPTTDRDYLRALWCQAEGFELLNPQESVYILPTVVVELLRMTEHLLNTDSSAHRVRQLVRTEYRQLYWTVRSKLITSFCRKKLLETFMDSI